MSDPRFRDYVGRALEALGQHLPHYVGSKAGSPSGLAGSSDPHKALKAIFADWDRLGRAFDKPTRNRLHELLELRNKWAHHEDLTWDDSYRAVESTKQVLSAIGVADVAMLDEFRRELLSAQSLPTRASPATGGQLVAIIACTKMKRRGTWPAIQLYDPSPLFLESVKVALAESLPILVLSTKYGLVVSDEPLAWYEQQLDTMTREQWGVWNATVARQLADLKARFNIAEALLFVGRNYQRAISPILDAASIGHQVHPKWLTITERVFGRSPRGAGDRDALL